MKTWRLQFFSLVIIALSGLIWATRLSAAPRLVTPMYKAHWQFSGTREHCQLTLPNKKLGGVHFIRDAGEPLRFSLTPLLKPNHLQTIKVYWQNAPWFAADKGLTYPVYVDHGAAVSLNSYSSRQLLDSLNEGRWAVVELDEQQLTLPSIRWQDAASLFAHCVHQLLPMSYRQARDQVLFYRSGQRFLQRGQKQLLNHLAAYITSDDNVNAVWVDAYTDNVGDHFANLQLSRERAADVKSVLVEAGVPSSLITTRAHGDRYPSANNQSLAGQAQNRRVTVRIIRKLAEKDS